MKKQLQILLVFCLVTLGLASMACAEPITLSYTNFFPPDRKSVV